MHRISRLRCLLLLPLMCVGGCLPGVGWLPDSSGFVFVGGKDGKQLLHFDVAAGKAKVILDDAKANTLWPAVSPDGKTIALAQLTGMGRGPSKLHVRLVDLDGKELSVSAPVEVRDNAGEFSPRTLPQLFWSPKGDKILIHADMATLIHDVKKGTFHKNVDTIPVIFGPGPITPDGKTFVVWADKKEGTLPHALMDWEGKLHALESGPGLAEFVKSLEEKKGNDAEENQRTFALLSPAMFAGRWSDSLARVRWAGIEFQIDAKAKSMTGKRVKQEKIDGKEIESEVELKDATIQFIRLEQKKPDVEEQSLMLYRVRIDVKAKTRRTLVEKADQVVLIPSPDRKLIVLRCAIPLKDGDGLARSDYQDRILVLNEEGTVVGNWTGPLPAGTLPK